MLPAADVVLPADALTDESVMSVSKAAPPWNAADVVLVVSVLGMSSKP